MSEKNYTTKQDLLRMIERFPDDAIFIGIQEDVESDNPENVLPYTFAVAYEVIQSPVLDGDDSTEVIMNDGTKLSFGELKSKGTIVVLN